MIYKDGENIRCPECGAPDTEDDAQAYVGDTKGDEGKYYCKCGTVLTITNLGGNRFRVEVK